MKVFMCVLVIVAATASAVPTSPPAPQTAQASPAASAGSSSSSSLQQGSPSQVANKRGDTDFATSASQQQPVYSPQQPSHSQGASRSDYQSSASSNGNLYYYYYPASQVSSGKSEATGSDPYQASAASSYPSYSGEGGSHSPQQHSGYDSSAFGNSAYQSQLQQAYAAAHQAHGGSPSYSYGGSLLPADSQLNAQYASGSGAPVAGFQNQGSYPAQGSYQASPSSFQPTYAPAGDSKSRLYGLGSVIMPLVGLGALAFLLPSVTNLGGKKKTKRSVDANEPSKANGVAEYAERLEKYFKIYRAAVESDDCMNRIVCEVGDSVSTVRGKAALLALFEKVAPQWMAGKMGVFKFGALNEKSPKCARYKC